MVSTMVSKWCRILSIDSIDPMLHKWGVPHKKNTPATNRGSSSRGSTFTLCWLELKEKRNTPAPFLGSILPPKDEPLRQAGEELDGFQIANFSRQGSLVLLDGAAPLMRPRRSICFFGRGKTASENPMNSGDGVIRGLVCCVFSVWLFFQAFFFGFCVVFIYGGLS